MGDEKRDWVYWELPMPISPSVFQANPMAYLGPWTVFKVNADPDYSGNRFAGGFYTEVIFPDRKGLTVAPHISQKQAIGVLIGEGLITSEIQIARSRCCLKSVPMPPKTKEDLIYNLAQEGNEDIAKGVAYGMRDNTQQNYKQKW
jgi:hypothetical protein